MITAGRIAAAVLLLSSNLGHQSQPRPGTSHSTPFAVGEKLVYRVEWSPPWYLFFLPTMEAGEAELTLADRTLVRVSRRRAPQVRRVLEA